MIKKILNEGNEEFEELEIAKEEPLYTDLRDVMDYTRKLKMFFSGVENESYLDILYEMGVRDFLMSYEYLRTKGRDRLRKYPDMSLFIDSGAYTYMNDPKYEEYTVEMWEKQIEQYLKWARRHKDCIFAICDLDLQYLVGAEKVYEWRKKYFEPFMLETGIPVCFMYHDEGMEQWEYMCERYPYVGLSLAIDKKNHGRDELLEMFRIAERHNALCQGMASTNTSMLIDFPFYSVDSSVDGKSSVVVRDTINNTTERMNIEDLYKKLSFAEFKTTPNELRIPTEIMGYEVLTVDNDNKVVWERLDAVVKHTVAKKTIKLSIEGGNDITCTNDHSIITMNKEGDLVETKADELEIGDYVLSPKSYSLENEEQELVESLIQKHGFSKENLELNVTEISDDLLQFLGLWVGDGSYQTNSPTELSLSCYQDKECKEVIDTICEVFKAKPSVKPNKVDVSISNSRLRRIMENLEFKGTSHTKRVPSFIYSLSERQIGQFLKGYFSADGTGSCECSTVSEGLKNDLVELLNMMGIYTSVTLNLSKTFTQNEKTYLASDIYHITVGDIESQKIFRDKIGFLQEYKNDKLDECINSTNSRGSRRECIPKELSNKEIIRMDSKRTKRVSSFKGRINRKYREAFNEKVVDSEVNFLMIKDIEEVNDGKEEVEVYDLSVNKYEKFIANGVLVHNTSWNVGLKFGEISIWNGTKMGRVKKTEFESRGFPVISKYDYPFDLDLILAEDKTELIKVNAYAFIEAEKYVHERLSAKMYWLKAKTNKVDTNNLPEDFFPPLEWFENPEGLEEYAEKMNINPEYEGAKDMIYDVTAFLNWDNEEYQEMHETYLNEEGKLLIDLHDTHINRIVPNEQVMIEDLIKFFSDCVSGENDRLLLVGTNFDRIVHERESYIEEDNTELVDMDESEIKERLSNILPSGSDEDPAPDITELDDEIFSNLEVVPVRDEKGRFLKGQKKVKKPKKLYSKRYPKFSCDTCHGASRCSEYKAGYVCAFSKMFDRYNTRDMGDIIESMQGIVEHNMTRMQKAMLVETINGTVDPMVSQLMDTNMRYMMQLKQMYEYGSPEVLRKTTTIRADGSSQETIQATNPQGGGILEKLFSMSKAPHEIEEEDERKRQKLDDIVEGEIVEEED